MTDFKPRWIHFHPDEWLAGTFELSLEEQGAYWRVCALIYSRGGPLPDNDPWVGAQLGVSTRKWRALKATLVAAGKLSTRDGRISQSRCEAELVRAQIQHKLSVESGAKGGRSNARKNWPRAEQNRSRVERNESGVEPDANPLTMLEAEPRVTTRQPASDPISPATRPAASDPLANQNHKKSSYHEGESRSGGKEALEGDTPGRGESEAGDGQSAPVDGDGEGDGDGEWLH